MIFAAFEHLMPTILGRRLHLQALQLFDELLPTLDRKYRLA
jgi:hypothetical protein